MPSQRGNREQGFSSDEDSANDSSFEKIGEFSLARYWSRSPGLWQ